MSIIKLLARMLEKDLKLFWRDRRTFLLVIFAPVVIMLVLANIFNVPDTRESIKGVTIGVCNLDKKSIDLTSDVFDVYAITGDCEQRAKEMVGRGELRISVVIPVGFFDDIQNGHGTVLHSYVDNSKGQISLVATAALRAYVAELNEEIGTSFILAAWDALRDLNGNLKELIIELDKGITLTTGASRMTRELQVNLSSVDLDDLKARLDTLNLTLVRVQSSLDLAQSGIHLLEIPVNVSTDPGDSFYQRYCLEYSSINGTLYGSLSEEAWEDWCGPLGSALGGFSSLNSSFNDTLGLADDVLIPLGLMEHDMSGLATQITKLYSLHASMEQWKAHSDAEILGVSDVLDDYAVRMRELRDDLQKTTFILEDYTSRDPKAIIHPVVLEEEKAFAQKKVLFFMLPGIITLILLFVTMFISSSVIVNERRSGTMARNFLSPVGVFFFLFQKMMYLLLLSGIQLVSMSVVGALLGVPLAWSWSLMLVLVVVSASFISVGMVIGAFSKTENTALLSALVIGLPMMFLSGVFFPFEIMPTIMRTIGYYLPLTLSVLNLDRLLVYGISIDWWSLGILAGITLALYLIAALLIKKNPMAD